MDAKNFTQAMRLFKGVPVWTPINRPCEEHLSRARYLQRFQPLIEEQALRRGIVRLGGLESPRRPAFKGK